MIINNDIRSFNLTPELHKNLRQTVYEAISKQAEKEPNATAVEFVGTKISYKRILIDSLRLSAAFAQLGVRKGSRIAIFSQNSVNFIVASLACNKIGAIAVPINVLYTETELEHILNDSKPEILVCQDSLYQKLVNVISTTSVRNIIITNLGNYLPIYKRLIGKFMKKIPKAEAKIKGENIYYFNRLIKGFKPDSSPKVEVDAEDPYLVLYTSGTTGLPKGAILTSRAVLYYAYQQINIFYSLRKAHPEVGNKVRLLLVPPMYHILGHSMMVTALASGGTVVLLPMPNLNEACRIMASGLCNFMTGPPSLYTSLLELDQLDEYIDKIRSSHFICHVGGERVPVELYARMKSILNKDLQQAYASTEGGLSFQTLYGEEIVGSAGKPTLGVEVRIQDTLSGEIKEYGEGELLVRSPGMFSGYLNQPEKTKESLVEIDGKLYYRTGDIVRITHDEKYGTYMTFIDRVADVIKYKGYQVSTTEVENVIMSHPAVQEAAVVGIPDPKRGTTRIKAYVVLKKEAGDVTALDIKRFCRERLAPFKVPHEIEFRSYLPRGRIGKVMKRILKEEASLTE